MVPRSPASAIRRLVPLASGTPPRLVHPAEREEVPLARDGAEEMGAAEFAARLVVLLRWT